MLFVDADGNGVISDKKEYVFTEWDASAADDMEALRRVFDGSGDGRLMNPDAKWGRFGRRVAGKGPGWRGGGRHVQVWTLGELRKSQGSVKFCSSNVKGMV